jgi:hypothetical protein
MAAATNDLAFYGAMQKALFIKQLTLRLEHAVNFGPAALAKRLRARIATEQDRLNKLTALLPAKLAEAIKNA